MTLPSRISKPSNRTGRWKSPAHRAWVRGFTCCNCGSSTNVIAAHVRIGSHTGMGQKPHDWRVVPLCDGLNANNIEQLGCHDRQHIIGEQTFWDNYATDKGQTVEQLIAELSKASPKALEIRNKQRELADG